MTACQNYHELTRGELQAGFPGPEEAIRVSLKDGRVVAAGSYRHLYVTDSADYVVGVGTERKTSRPFSGIIRGMEMDSSTVLTVRTNSGGGERSFLCWLKDGRTYSFAEYDHISVTPDSASGLWCAGTIAWKNRTSHFKGRVARESVSKVEVGRIALFSPLDPFATGSDDIYSWGNIGFGGAAPTNARGGLSTMFSYSKAVQSSLYTIRLTITRKVNFFGSTPSHTMLGDLGILYGVVSRSRFFSSFASAGIAYTWGALAFDRDEFATVGIPWEAGAAVTPFSTFGISGKLFGNLNSKQSVTGIVVCLEFGIN